MYSTTRRHRSFLTLTVVVLGVLLASAGASLAAKPPVATAPAIAALSGSNAAPGEYIDVTGSGFGSKRTGDIVTFGGVPASVYSSWSDTRITVQVPAGAVRGDVVVEVDRVPSNGVPFTPWNPPVLSAVSPDTAPAGSTVTLVGSGFGTTQSGSVVSFGGVPATVVSWSDAALSVQVPAIASASAVVVDRGGLVSNSVVFTPQAVTSSAPIVDGLSASDALVGSPLTITGSNFGASRGAGTVTFGGTPATVTDWTDTAITVLVAGDGPVVVTQNGLSSNGVAFDGWTAPVASALDPAAAGAGATVRITGSGFGDVQGTGTVTFTGTAATVAGWTDTAIDVVVPDVASGDVVVTQRGIATSPLAFTRLYGAPAIEHLSASDALVGSPLTITGSNFGASRGAGTVTFGGTPATVTDWTDTAITVLVAGDGPVVVTQNGLSSNGMLFTSFHAPILTSLSTNRAPLGTSITITGSNFEAEQGAGVVRFAGVDAEIQSWTDTTIVALVPNASPGQVTVVQHGVESNGMAFEPLRVPVISSLSSTSGQVGSSITISGAYFGSSGTVTIGGSAGEVASWSDTSIIVRVAAGTTSGDLVVHASNGDSNAIAFKVFTAARVTQMVPVNTGDPLSDGEHFILQGSGFEAEQGTGWVTWAGAQCPVVRWSDTEIEAVVPDGAPAGYVGVWQNGVCSNGMWGQFNPAIDTMSNWVAVVGSQVTITGRDFGAMQTSRSKVAISGVTCDIVSWSDTEIVFTVPPITQMGYVGVYRDGVGSNGKQLVPAPRLTSLSTLTAAPGEQLTIYGEAFGSAQGPDDVVKIGGTVVPVVSWSDTAIVVSVSDQASTGYVGVYRGVASSNGLWFLPAYPPTIASISTTSAAAGDTVTITGTGFYEQSGGSRVTLGGYDCSITSWSPTQITVSIPAGATSGLIGVWNYGLCSNGINLELLP